MRLTLIVMMVCALGASSSAAKAQMTLDGLLDVLEATGEAINDISVTYDFEIVEPNMVSVVERARQRGSSILAEAIHTELRARKPFKGFYSLSEIEVTTDGWGNVIATYAAQTYNSQQARFIERHERGGVVQTSREGTGVVARVPSQGLRINSTPLGYTVFREDETDDRTKLDLPKFIRYLRAHPRVEVKYEAEEKKINGFNAVCVEARFIGETGGVGPVILRRYYFSIDNNFALVSVAFGEVPCYDVLALTKLDNGIWFPTEGRMVTEEVTNRFKVTKVAVNQGLTEKDFAMTFPPGTRVEDRITGRTYVVKPTEEQLDESLPKK